MIELLRVNKTSGLYHVDILTKITMQEPILDIQLAKWSSTSNSKTKNQTNGGKFD